MTTGWRHFQRRNGPRRQDDDRSATFGGEGGLGGTRVGQGRRAGRLGRPIKAEAARTPHRGIGNPQPSADHMAPHPSGYQKYPINSTPRRKRPAIGRRAPPTSAFSGINAGSEAPSPSGFQRKSRLKLRARFLIPRPFRRLRAEVQAASAEATA